MNLIAQLFIGFSIFSAAILIVGNLLRQFETQQLPSKLAGFFLVISLALIQFLHLRFILDPSISVFSPAYIALLYCVAPSFYFYSCRLLTDHIQLNRWQLLHAIPVLVFWLLPTQWALPFVFFIGSGYLLWLARAVYLLREQRQRFKLEILALAGFFLIAISVIALGFIWPLINDLTFIVAYSCLIGIAFFATLLTLLNFPSITIDIAEAVQATYAESTLKNIDCDKVLVQLTQLMEQEKLYTLENLNLSFLAEQLALNAHQLSELINTEFKQGVSKYIRQYRIEAAKKLLVEEPKSSVLSIGLSVGFSSQSNFYIAFKDSVGMAPGQYRKQIDT